MRKEVIIAILIGFVLGLIITFGIYTANKALKQQKETAPLPTNGAAASPTPSPMINLEITEPEENLVVKKDKITISGKTEAKATVAILAEDNETLVLADEEGVFSGEIELTGGSNEIKVIALGKSGEKQEKVFNIVYSTAKIE